MSQTKAQLVDAVDGSIVDADITGLSASKLSGALPAISAANLTSVPSGNQNLIINGAMNVAQRGTSSTSSGYHTIDRFKTTFAGTDEAPTFAQADVASGTTPYTSGFRKCLKVTNGNQTSGAGAADNILISYSIEAQDLATSGCIYTSSSSDVTLSFWVKSSVAQNFYGFLLTDDGSSQLYSFETGSLSADTWTKVTKTISGNSNLTFNNDNGEGILLRFVCFQGTDNTGSTTLNQWAAWNSSAIMPDNTSTWYTTNNATFELTGVQLEVGSTATSFEHRSYGQELMLCRRYYQGPPLSSTGAVTIYGCRYSTSSSFTIVEHIPHMRAVPTLTYSARATSSGWNYASYSGKERFQVLMTSVSGYVSTPAFDAEL